jgi:hypothetical protein
MYEDNNKSFSITAEQQKEAELRQEKEFVVYYLRKALVMVGDMAISEAIEQLEDEMSDDAMIETAIRTAVKECFENTITNTNEP